MVESSVDQLPSQLIDDPTWRGKTVADDWHVLRNLNEVEFNIDYETVLLDIPITFNVKGSIEVHAWVNNGSGNRMSGSVSVRLKTCVQYGYIWVSLGQPIQNFFEMPEYYEPDRRNIHAATIRVKVSAPRAIENFLDLAHFPFVHPGSLGEEPYTEIKDYDVDILEESNEVLAQQCRVWQPNSMPTATEGYEVEYVYRVPHPYCAILYKANAIDMNRMDVISLFVQPVGEEECNANMLLTIIDDQNSNTAIRSFQQMIFAQDKPILENQVPKRLPLDLRAETSVRCDATSTAYRRWLHKRDVRFGTISRS
jgi:phenylpropionate dioxygenase-like ring-hydroxylating dioxygenase large terminal subunit